MSRDHLFPSAPTNSRSFINGASEEAPAFALMGVTGVSIVNGRAFYTIAKPSATARGRYVINGPVPVAAGEKGTCFVAGEVQVAYDTGSPACDEEYGPKASQWTASADTDSPIIIVSGIIDSTNKRLLGLLVAGSTKYAKTGFLDEALAQGESATMSVTKINGSDLEVDTGDNIEIWDTLGNVGDDDLPAFTRVIAIWSSDSNRWIYSAGNCNAESEVNLPETE